MLCIAIISVLKAIAWLYILFFDRREQVSIDLEKYKKEKERLWPALFFCVSFISLLYFRFNFFIISQVARAYARATLHGVSPYPFLFVIELLTRFFSSLYPLYYY